MQNCISCLVGAFWGVPRVAQSITTKASFVLMKSRASHDVQQAEESRPGDYRPGIKRKE
jgi:hypothetical protein